MSRKKTLLMVYHTQSGNTEKLANAAYRGACEAEEIDTRLVRAYDASLQDLLNCQALLIGSPENFGYMSGGIKDFFDRTFYPAQDFHLNLPYALFISCGNDGTGAVRQIDRIMIGYPMRKVAEPVICPGEVRPEYLERCEELGLTLAMGLTMGIF